MPSYFTKISFLFVSLFVVFCVSTSLALDRESDSLALVAIYEDNNGPNWTNEWDLSDPMDDWHGVTLTSGRVTRLDLGNNGLDDTLLLSDIGDLSELTHLYFNKNSIEGSIPSEIGDLDSLKYLDLSDNYFSGSIPSQLGNLSNLKYLIANRNDLSGSIPSEIGNCTKLNQLQLAGNDLTGSIPSNFQKLSNLTRLHLNQNQLSGSIPSWIDTLSKLNILDLYSNNFSGTIPEEVGNLSDLWYLYLFNNNFSGTVPNGLGELSSCTKLYLYNNNFSGTVPSDFGNLSSIKYLYLQENQFTNIGDSLVKLTNLTALDLGTNELCNLSCELEQWADENDPDWYQTQDCDIEIDSGLVAYWKFDEGSGDTAYDSSSNNYKGVLDNASWSGNGISGNAVDFDESSVEIIDDIDAFQSAYSISGWFKVDRDVSQQVILGLSKPGTNDHGILLELKNATYDPGTGGLRFLQRFPYGNTMDANSTHAIDSSTLTDSTWHFFTCSKDSSKMRVYIDGSLTTKVDETDFVDQGLTCKLGKLYSNYRYFYGLIDEVRIYSKRLSSSEVFYIYSLHAGFESSEDNNYNNGLNIIITKSILPDDFKLSQNLPNPFNNTTTIKFVVPFNDEVPAEHSVKLQIFNLKGQLVRTIVNDNLKSGYHSVVWDGKDKNLKSVNTGIYIYKLISGDFTQSRKMFLTR